MTYYRLEGRTPVPSDVATWSGWFRTADRVVARTEVDADTFISTVFTGFDTNIDPDNPAIFESEVFRAGDAPPDRFRQSYATWKAAELGHAALVERYSRQP